MMLLCLVLQACSRSVDLYSGLSESDANEIVAVLMRHDMAAAKSQAKSGFVVAVGQSDFEAAVALLRVNGLPRRAYSGLGEVFKKDGMISTPTEERARYLFALSQELESTLMGIDGVVLARVHPVLPERLIPGEPVLAASCSVLVKHRPGWDSSLYEDKIRRLVTAGIPGLAGASSSNISVVFVPIEAEPSPSAESASRGAAAWRGVWIALVAVPLLGAAALLGRWAVLKWRPQVSQKSLKWLRWRGPDANAR